ncbi:MAG: AAA family ATPase [Acutalibacteraceae bacterium]|nr:AAA family ATPase [Acutalibacteraceae bacterium]
MKIDSVYISAFGKFEDKTFDFSHSLNVIYGENEDGKTTLMNFIIMMFYGSNAKSSDPLYINPRKKYLPRSDKAMAGSIDFTKDNRKYRIERIFKSTNASDKITVTDLSTGESESFSGKDDLGKRFIGLTRESALRSIFLSSHGAITENPIAQDELNSRLSNIAHTGSEDVSFEAISSRLEKARNSLLTKTERGGKIARDKEKLNELILSLSEAKATEQKRRELELSIENKKAMLNDINSDISKLTAQIKAAQGGKRYAKLKELVDTSRTLDSLSSKLVCTDGTEITNLLVSQAEASLSEYKILTETIEAVKERHQKLENEIEQLKEKLGGQTADEIAQELKIKKSALKEADDSLNKKQELCESLNNKLIALSLQKPKIRPLFLISTIFFLILCGASFLVRQYTLPVLVVSAVLAVIMLILTFALKKKPFNNAEELKEELQKAQTQLKELDEKAERLNAQISELTTKEAVQRQKEADAGEKFTSKYEEYKQCCDELDKKNTRIDEILKSFKLLSQDKAVSVKGMEIILFSHKTNLSKLEAAQMRLAMLKNDLDDISIEEAQKELSSIPEGVISVGDPDELDNRLLFKKQEADSLKQKIAEDSTRATTEFAFHTHPTIIEKEIAALTETLKKESDYCESLDIAASVLSDAFAKVRESFGSALSQRTGEIFSAITSGKYKSVNVSKSFNISVEETDVFGTNDWQSLSDGTIDQAYFALRLAVSEFLSGDSQKLPLILDDSFDRYDDNRAEKAMEFLNSYAKDKQVLFFTCHKTYTEKYPFITLK